MTSATTPRYADFDLFPRWHLDRVEVDKCYETQKYSDDARPCVDFDLLRQATSEPALWELLHAQLQASLRISNTLRSTSQNHCRLFFFQYLYFVDSLQPQKLPTLYKPFGAERYCTYSWHFNPSAQNISWIITAYTVKLGNEMARSLKESAASRTKRGHEYTGDATAAQSSTCTI